MNHEETLIESSLTRPDTNLHAPSLIREFFTKDQLKALLYFTCRVDIGDNNTKAEVLRRYLEPYGFDEIGTGTNRIAFLKNGLVFKISLDRRGHVDSFTEFKRSLELPEYLAMTYETNMIMNVCEYVSVLDQEEFIIQKPVILATLEDISKAYLFNDLGFVLKNSMNWGARDKDSRKDASVCVLDYGYFYSLVGQDRDKLFSCPICGSRLLWNKNYTGFICDKTNCGYTATPGDIRNRMRLDLEDAENQILSSINETQVPDFTNYEQYITNMVK